MGKELVVSNNILDDDTYFRVICGSYKDRSNAIKQQNKLKAAGFDSFLEVLQNS